MRQLTHSIVLSPVDRYVGWRIDYGGKFRRWLDNSLVVDGHKTMTKNGQIELFCVDEF